MTINPLICVGIPTFGKVSMRWANARNQMSFPLGSSSMSITLDSKEDTIADKRNIICKEALEKNTDYIFMLGDDVIPPSNTILQLLSRKVDLVTGIYWTKTNPTQPYIWKGMQRGFYLDWKAGEFFKVDFAGCDCLLIRTEILKDMAYPWFSIEWKWSNEQERPSGMNTEDFHFYLKAAAQGYNLWADTTIQCYHEDRESGAVFGITEDMPQMTEKRKTDYKGKRIADLGCGLNNPFFDFDCEIVRFDVDESVKPDVRCDLRNIPENDETFDIVYSQHSLEHFGRYEVQKVLHEWIRLLKVGGKLEIRVPNLKYAFKNILEAKSIHYEWWQIYGAQTDKWDFHGCGFIKETLENLLKKESCLSDVVVNEQNENLLATAIKAKKQEMFVLMDWWNKAQAKKNYYKNLKNQYEKQSIKKIAKKK